jgi:TRAP-type mannitol/chloroaromatic compound transport system permease large subunit
MRGFHSCITWYCPLFLILAVLGTIFAVNLQTSFMTPPFGPSLFYLKGVCPPQVTTIHLYRGIIPFVILQLIGLTIIAIWPGLVTWLPAVVYGS